ncbi:MAG: thermonuclease family protein [Alphaproteobacteria bacterium]|nr:thermonuclease family protein [Alphaproteobacteria bacterium]
MRAYLSAILLGTLLATPAKALPLPDCAGPVVSASAKIQHVERDGTLVLRDGRQAVLAGLRLPGADAPSSAVAAAAIQALSRLVLEGPLVLTSSAPQKDRYGRLRVQAFGKTWLQTELLARGLARASVAPDRQECAPDFYEAETSARAARRGLWTLPQFAVRDALSLSAPAGSFQLVAGRVIAVARHDGRVFLDFRADYRKGFSATIAPADRKPFDVMEPPLEELVGHRIRLRGIVESFSGRLEMALSSPRQVEMLD